MQMRPRYSMEVNLPKNHGVWKSVKRSVYFFRSVDRVDEVEWIL